MDKTMKKTLIIAALAVACAGTCLARPHHGGHGHRGGFGGPRPAMYHGGHHHHHHGGSFWGHGGRNFWPGFVGGMVGGVVGGVVAPRPSMVVAPAPVVVNPAPVVVNPAPVVVSTPVYSMQNVWVEGRYVDQVQPNGAVLRVWQPGHYEQRQVQAY